MDHPITRRRRRSGKPAGTVSLICLRGREGAGRVQSHVDEIERTRRSPRGTRGGEEYCSHAEIEPPLAPWRFPKNRCRRRGQSGGWRQTSITYLSIPNHVTKAYRKADHRRVRHTSVSAC